MNELRDDQLLTIVKNVVEQHGCKLVDIDFETHSLHIEGRAIDLRLPGTPLDTVHRAALALRAGGVGYYRASDFVHVDTGSVRAW